MREPKARAGPRRKWNSGRRGLADKPFGRELLRFNRLGAGRLAQDHRRDPRELDGRFPKSQILIGLIDDRCERPKECDASIDFLAFSSTVDYASTSGNKIFEGSRSRCGARRQVIDGMYGRLRSRRSASSTSISCDGGATNDERPAPISGLSDDTVPRARSAPFYRFADGAKLEPMTSCGVARTTSPHALGARGQGRGPRRLDAQERPVFLPLRFAWRHTADPRTGQ